MKHQMWTAAAVAAAAAAMAGPASAAASAAAELSGWTYTLYDLRPDDGIDASIEFFDGYAYASASYSTDTGSIDSEFNSASGWFGETAAAISGSLYSADAAVGAGTASASTALAGGFAPYAVVSGFGQTSHNFALSAWTGIVMTASFVGQAQTTIGYDGVGAEYAGAEGYLSLFISAEGGGQNSSAYRGAYASYEWDGSGYVGQSKSFAGDVSLSFANFSDVGATGQMTAYASAYSQSAIPVPEPQTYALLLAGLAGIGAVVRRRRG